MKPTRQVDWRAGFGAAAAIAVIGAVLVSAALGLAVAFMVTRAPSEGQAEAGRPEQTARTDATEQYVSFGTVVSNLSGGRMTRYLQLSITVRAQKDSAEAIRKQFEDGDKAMFKNWLITYLSDKQLDEVEGAAAIKKLQREIQDGFNALLAKSGDCKVDEVLFEEFNIQ